MMQKDPCFLDAAALMDGYRTGVLTPVQVVDAYLDRITALNPKLHAYIDVFAEEARLQAAQSLANFEKGTPRRLEGIPIALKDLLEISGKICTAGSATRLDHVATRTATIAKRLMAQGAIVLGKVHTVEFAFGGWGTNQHLGTPWNPWSETVHLTPGGSSSGSGVAVAARLAPWAIGTDTGGSVRIPAAFNGIVGLKTTFGRISTYGVVPLTPSLDTPGVLARTVRDAAVLFDALYGEDPNDPTTRGLPPCDVFTTLEKGVVGLRVGAISAADREGIDAEVLAAYDASLARFDGMGAEVVPLNLPKTLISYGFGSPQMAAEAYALHGGIADDLSRPMGDAVRARIASGNIAAAFYLRARAGVADDTRAFMEAIQGVDVLVVPTAQTPPIPVDAVDESTTAAILTRFANILGLCGVAVPCGYTEAGLPLSIQLVCRPYEEALALRTARAFEKQMGVARLPVLAG
jgi:aspartyl-tRNA(Asn)/glutamyl-tRNA(Gln) amidotransferase subunit A